MKRNLLAVLFCAGWIGSNTVSANAVVVATFEPASTGILFTSPLSENGITFTVLAGHYDIEDFGSGKFMNLDNQIEGLVTMNITYNGGTFDLTSLDLVNFVTSGAFTISSNLGGVFNVPSSLGTVTSFGPGFTGVSTVTITESLAGFMGFDNFTITPTSAETPLPAALPLFATGLGALGLLGWRRKKRPAALAA
jgi:hypothetical protein